MNTFSQMTVESCFLAFVEQQLREWVQSIKQDSRRLKATLELEVVPTRITGNSSDSDFVTGVRAAIALLPHSHIVVSSRKFNYTFSLKYRDDRKVQIHCVGYTPR
jgi:hypothetical protein